MSRARVERLEKALEVYAEPSNWADYLDTGRALWIPEGDGYDIARAALEARP